MFVNTLGKITSLILDMDGVLWRENTPIGNLPFIFSRFKEENLSYMLATNNGTRTPEQYIKKLASFGVELQPDQIVTSAIGIAYLLKKSFPSGGPVYIVGEVGLTTALQEAGFYHAEKDCLAVIGGMDRGINFIKLRQATLLIRQGLPFYFTNPDRTYPTPEGLIPGAGAILAALEAATDAKATIAGKPSSALFGFSLEKLGSLPTETLVVGDRLETDILGGQNAGCLTAAVLSGVATKQEVLAWRPKIDLILGELEDLVRG
jgi:4-nitrophenyl phosphatase